MKPIEPTILRRECQAIEIPSGALITLPASSAVRIMQSLGGTYTAMTSTGRLVRIAGTDADALGMEAAPEAAATLYPAALGPQEIEQLVWDQLKTCFDPEIPVDIVALGLVYHCEVTPLPEGGNQVNVKFTLTAPGCGMGAVLKADIERKIRQLPGVTNVDVEVVFDPPWNQDMMSEAARLELGLL